MLFDSVDMSQNTSKDASAESDPSHATVGGASSIDKNGNSYWVDYQTLMSSIEPIDELDNDTIRCIRGTIAINIPKRCFSNTGVDWYDLSPITAERGLVILIYFLAVVLNRVDLSSQNKKGDQNQRIHYQENDKPRFMFLCEELIKEKFVDKVEGKLAEYFKKMNKYKKKRTSIPPIGRNSIYDEDSRSQPTGSDDESEANPNSRNQQGEDDYDVEEILDQCEEFAGIRIWILILDPTIQLEKAIESQIRDNDYLRGMKNNSKKSGVQPPPWECYMEIHDLVSWYSLACVPFLGYDPSKTMPVLNSKENNITHSSSFANPFNVFSMKNAMDESSLLLKEGCSKRQMNLRNYIERGGSEVTPCKFPIKGTFYQIHPKGLEPKNLAVSPLPHVMLRKYQSKVYFVTDNEEESKIKHARTLSIVINQLKVQVDSKVKKLQGFASASKQEQFEQRNFVLKIASENEKLITSIRTKFLRLQNPNIYDQPYEDFSSEMANFREQSMQEFWARFNGAQGNATKPVSHGSQWFSKLPTSKHFVEVLLQAENLSPFASSIVYLMSGLEYLLTINYHFRYCILRILSAYNSSYPEEDSGDNLKLNVILSGDPGTGKSFPILKVDSCLFFPEFAFAASHVTTHAFTGGEGDMSDMSFTYHETPLYMLGRDNRGNEISDPLTKTRLSEGVVSTVSFKLNPITKARGYEIVHNRCIGSNFFITNDQTPRKGSGLDDRSLWCAVRDMERPDLSKQETNFVTKSKDQKVISESFEHSMKLVSFYILLWNQLIRAGIMPFINTEHHDFTAEKLFERLIEKSGDGAKSFLKARKIKALRQAAVAITQYYGIITVLFGELGLKFRQEKDGKPRSFDIKDMLALLPFSWVPEEATIYAFTLLEDQWLETDRVGLLDAMKRANTIPIDASITKFRKTNDKNTFDYHYLEFSSSKDMDVDMMQEFLSFIKGTGSAFNMKKFAENMSREWIESNRMELKAETVKRTRNIQISDSSGLQIPTVEEYSILQETLVEIKDKDGKDVIDRIPKVIVDKDPVTKKYRICIARELFKQSSSVGGILEDAIQSFCYDKHPNRSYITAIPYRDYSLPNNDNNTFHQLLKTIEMKKNTTVHHTIKRRHCLDDLALSTVLNKTSGVEEDIQIMLDTASIRDVDCNLEEAFAKECFHDMGLTSEQMKTALISIPENAEMAIRKVREQTGYEEAKKRTLKNYPDDFAEYIKNKMNGTLTPESMQSRLNKKLKLLDSEGLTEEISLLKMGISQDQRKEIIEQVVMSEYSRELVIRKKQKTNHRETGTTADDMVN